MTLYKSPKLYRPQFPHLQVGIVTGYHLLRLLWRLNVLVNVNQLLQCPAYSKHSIRVSYYQHISFGTYPGLRCEVQIQLWWVFLGGFLLVCLFSIWLFSCPITIYWIFHLFPTDLRCHLYHMLHSHTYLRISDLSIDLSIHGPVPHCLNY